VEIFARAQTRPRKTPQTIYSNESFIQRSSRARQSQLRRVINLTGRHKKKNFCLHKTRLECDKITKVRGKVLIVSLVDCETIRRSIKFQTMKKNARSVWRLFVQQRVVDYTNSKLCEKFVDTKNLLSQQTVNAGSDFTRLMVTTTTQTQSDVKQLSLRTDRNLAIRIS